MRILVTGAAGFIGRHLCVRLKRDGHNVIGLDYNASFAREWFEQNSIRCLDEDVRFCADYSGYDRVYHLACNASPKHYLTNPVETLETAFLGTVNVIRHSAHARVLLASTSEIYGDAEVVPTPEEYFGNVNPISMRSCYDEGKRAAETFAVIGPWAGRCRIARIFNTYGPGMNIHDGRVIVEFVKRCLREIPMEIHGGGSQTRSYCYVSDTVEGLIRLMESPYSFPINIGNPFECYTIEQTAGHVARACGVRPKADVVECPYPSDPQRRQPNIEKAKTLLEWMPRVSFEEGIYLTVEDIKRRLP